MGKLSEHNRLAQELASDITDELVSLGTNIACEVYCKLVDVLEAYDEQSLVRLSREVISERRKERIRVRKASEGEC